MKKKKLIAILCISLAALLLLATLGILFVCRPDWGFRLWNAIRIYPRPDWKELSISNSEQLALDALSSEEGSLHNLLLLINSTHALPSGYLPTLAEYNGTLMHPKMINDYIALRDALQEKTQERIYVSSDFRTAEEQAEILESSEEGIAAQVGYSEHEAGLALDVYVKGYGGKSFIKSRAGREIARICGEYGFIIRYPDGKEEITGTPYEPWHLRYVGRPHAEIIMRSGLTLEEYLDLLKPNVWFDTEDYLIGRFEAEKLGLPDIEIEEWSISPDNTGYYIITAKKS